MSEVIGADIDVALALKGLTRWQAWMVFAARQLPVRSSLDSQPLEGLRGFPVNRQGKNVDDRRSMVGGGLRYFGGAVAFGFAAVWIMASLAAALVCLLSAAVGYGVVLAVERARAKRALHAGIAEVEDFHLRADELNHDLGHVYEPTVAPPSAAETRYGWPREDDPAPADETPK